MTSTGTTTRTSAYRDEHGQNLWVGGGAVNQDGDLKLYVCNKCGGEVVWATSSRTGRVYLVNVHRGESGSRFYVKASTHDCEKVRAQRAASTAAYEQAQALSLEESKARQAAMFQEVYNDIWSRWCDEAGSAAELQAKIDEARAGVADTEEGRRARAEWLAFIDSKLAQRPVADRFPS